HRDLHSFPTRRSSDLEIQSLQATLSKVSISTIENEKAVLDASIEDILEASAHWRSQYETVIQEYKLQQELAKNKGALKENTTARSEEHTSELQSRENL